MVVTTRRLATALVASALAAATALAGDCDASAVLASVTSNLAGPAGKMIVAEGTLTLGGEVKKVKFAHYVSADGTEAFQGEDRAADDTCLQKIRLIRTPREQATTLVFVPSMRQGRKMRFAPTRPLFGSGEYHHYLLLPTGAFGHDYTFRCVTQEADAVVLDGTRNADAALAPYPAIRLTARRRGAGWAVEQADYRGTSEFSGFTQTFGEYSEVAPGWWAPKRIDLGDARVRLDWRVQPAVDWIASDQTAFMDRESIP